MRLYALLPNSLYLEKLHNNDKKFGRILTTDLLATLHGNLIPFLNIFFEIWDKREYIDSSILMFTTPAEMKRYLNNNFVGIAVETESKVLNINGNKFMEFVHDSFIENSEMFGLEANNDNFQEFLHKVSLKAEECEKEIAQVDYFYNAFGIIDEININEIRNLYYLKNNDIVEKIKQDENKKLFNFIKVEEEELGR